MNSQTQTPILQHLVEITGHRDHSRLELSVVSALRQLLDVQRICRLEFFVKSDRTFVRPHLLLDDGLVVDYELPGPSDDECAALSTYPELSACFEHRLSSAQRTDADGRYTLWLPVRLDEKIVSCFEIGNDQAYAPQTLEVIYGIVEVYRNYQSLLDYSERDALTGLFNRKTFDDQFARHAQGNTAPVHSVSGPSPVGGKREAQSEKQWLAVVDIDHFKLVNDRFGHVYGDEVLILVANLLRSSFRSNDSIFRFGGEEFVVLLRAASLESAQAIFNRFRTNIEQYDFPQVGRVTVSVGFTGTATGASVEILGHADQALYYAKQNGRNQVRYYEDLMAGGLLQAAKVEHDDVELF